MSRLLSAEDLLAGAGTTRTVTIPADLVPSGGAEDGRAAEAASVVVRPLTLRDVQRIVKASREEGVLSSVLTVQQALVEPALSVEQVASLPAGIVQLLLEQVNAASGLAVSADDLEEAVRAPLARACFVLAREFGWTPAECCELTLGQVLLYLEMLAREGADGIPTGVVAPAEPGATPAPPRRAGGRASA